MRFGPNVLRRALTLMGRRKWKKGGFVGQDGSVCLVAAVNSALGLTADEISEIDKRHRKAGSTAKLREKALVALSDVVREQFPERTATGRHAAEGMPPSWRDDIHARCQDIYTFNDHAETTVEQVLSVLDKGAVRYEEAEDQAALVTDEAE